MEQNDLWHHYQKSIHMNGASYLLLSVLCMWLLSLDVVLVLPWWVKLSLCVLGYATT